MAYDKMARELATNGLNDITQALIRTGKLVYFEAQGEGWVKHHNPSLQGSAFSEGVETTTVSKLPKNHVELDSGDANHVDHRCRHATDHCGRTDMIVHDLQRFCLFIH